MERKIMSKKIKMLGFETADLMNKLLVLPTMDNIVKEEKLDLAPIKEFIKQNEKDLAVLDKYFEDMASGYKAEQTILKPPESIETTTKNLVVQLQQVIKQHYPEIPVKPTVYRGTTAYYLSESTADFLDDGKDYFGHCVAFGKFATLIICAFIRLGYKFGALLIWGWFKIHLPQFADDVLDILQCIYDEIGEDIEQYEKNPTGMIWFYFDRVDKISKIHDEFVPKLQPSEKWDPSDYYPQADWKIFCLKN